MFFTPRSLVSSISSFLQKIDALRWTPHLDECLEVLDERRECLTDEILVQQVRMQLIIEKVTRGNWSDGVPETAEHNKIPVSFYLQALHSQLEEVKTKIPPRLQGNGQLPSTNPFPICSNISVEVVLAHYYSTELIINEVALSQTPIIANQPSFHQLERLYACIKSIKSWFEVFFTIPPVAYIGFPFSIFSQLVRCLVILYRLSTLDDPAWDKNGVRETANLLAIFDQVISNMEQVVTLSGLDNTGSIEGDVFSRTAKTFRALHPAWEAKLVGLQDPMVSTLPTISDVNDPPLPNAFLEDNFNNDWLMDLLLAPS